MVIVDLVLDPNCPEKVILWCPRGGVSGSYGTLEMSKHYECYNIPKRTHLKTVSDLKLS